MANYVPKNQAEATEIVERILPRLQHANASVVMSAIRVLMIYMEHLNDEWRKQVAKKMSPPLSKPSRLSQVSHQASLTSFVPTRNSVYCLEEYQSYSPKIA